VLKLNSKQKSMKNSSMYKPIIYFTLLLMLTLPGCNAIFTVKPAPTVVSTSTPERLKLIDGKIDACLVIRPEEIESVSGLSDIEVASTVFRLDGTTACRYISANTGQFRMIIFVATDTTLKEDKSSYNVQHGIFRSAAEQYEVDKSMNLKLFSAVNTPDKIKDIDGLGDHAYFKEGAILEIYILKNNIYYMLTTRDVESGGIGYDALMKLAQIALQRMP
jgi:hypothetical protein